MKDRPQRIRLRTELGLMQTPPPGPAQYAREGRGSRALLMGVGPDPAEAAALAPAGKALYVIEAPDFKAQMPPAWHEALPASWTFIDPAELTDDFLADSERIVYRPGVRLFPSFWGPLLGRARRAAAPSPAAHTRSVWLPGSARDLLVPEVEAAFQGAGLAVRRLDPKKTGQAVPALLRDERPDLFFCINFRGLDPFGELFHLLDAAGVPVVVWCVDNPFHLLSALRAPFWTRCLLAVTDDSFLPRLAAHGAENTLHLPLAAWPELFAPAPGEPDLGLDGRMVFVGRSQFPGRAKFFAGCSVPRWQADAAQTLLDQGGRPDFDWWAERLDIHPLWPGNDVRRIGHGAETASRDLRAACLMAALETGLTVYGDDGWRELLPPEADLRPPVDYYTALPAIYRQAAWTLGVTSLLLPHGLTQRHFDTWAAGGLLLTDDTPGLRLFPDALTREIAFGHPAEIPALAARLAPGTPLRRDLQSAWHAEILAHHTYPRRIATLLDHLHV